VSDDLVPVAHVLVHVREVLATDGRVGELGLDVEEALTADQEATIVVVRGAVSTEVRKSAIVPLVTEVLRAHGVQRDVRDDTHVTEPAPPDEAPEVL
jgi:hypothetical protein